MASSRSLCLLVALGLLISVAASAQVTIRPGDDSWFTGAGGSTFVDFSSNPIPAGFFGAGSLPFSGVVTFSGQPLTTNPAGALGSTDTLVRRLDNLVIPLGGSATTRIVITALNLVGQATVQFADGSTQVWMVVINLSARAPQPVGTMTITNRCNRGGTFSSTLPVVPCFTFLRGGTVLRLDCGGATAGCPATNLRSTGGCWKVPAGVCPVDPLPPNVAVDGDCDPAFDFATIGRRDFLPGYDGCAANPCTRCAIKEVHPVGAQHTVVPTFPCDDQGSFPVVDTQGRAVICHDQVPTDPDPTGTTLPTGTTGPIDPTPLPNPNPPTGLPGGN